MVRGRSITKAKMLLLRAWACRGGRLSENGGVNKFCAGATQINTASSESHEGSVSKKSIEGKKEGEESRGSSGCWVPHPRSGIYFPKGQDWVMNDVPENAARFTHTFWFRNVDGVDN